MLIVLKFNGQVISKVGLRVLVEIPHLLEQMLILFTKLSRSLFWNNGWEMLELQIALIVYAFCFSTRSRGIFFVEHLNALNARSHPITGHVAMLEISIVFKQWLWIQLPFGVRVSTDPTMKQHALLHRAASTLDWNDLTKHTSWEVTRVQKRWHDFWHSSRT